MPIEVAWGDPAQTTILLRLERGWTWEELTQAVAQADALITSVGHQVHLLIDLRGSGIPRDFLRVAQDLFDQGDARPNEGQRIVIGAGPLARAAYQGLRSVYGAQLAERPIRFADDLDQARQMLKTDTPRPI